MAWTASIGAARTNPVPSDSLMVPITFTNGEITFEKEFKFTSDTMQSAEDVAAFAANEANKIGAMYEAAAQLENVTTIQSTPRVVTNFQARAVMMQIPTSEGRNLFVDVDDYCKAAGGTVLQAWEYANNFYRTGALVNGLAPVFGLTESQLDELFQQAALIEA
jgi:hypothetical protein